MKFTITVVTPTSNRTIIAAWLAFETERGSLVIQMGHRPLIATLKPYSEIKFETEPGVVEAMDVAGGIVEIGRNFAMIVVG